MLLCIFYILIGIMLNVLSSAHVLDDFWSGFGVSIGAVGVVLLIRHIRYRTNARYKEEIDTRNKDERNRFLANKAWAWAGYLFVLICAVSVLVFKFLGQDLLMMAACTAECLLLVLYWLSYLVVSKKY